MIKTAVICVLQGFYASRAINDRVSVCTGLLHFKRKVKIKGWRDLAYSVYSSYISEWRKSLILNIVMLLWFYVAFDAFHCQDIRSRVFIACGSTIWMAVVTNRMTLMTGWSRSSKIKEINWRDYYASYMLRGFIVRIDCTRLFVVGRVRSSFVQSRKTTLLRTCCRSGKITISWTMPDSKLGKR